MPVRSLIGFSRPVGALAFAGMDRPIITHMLLQLIHRLPTVVSVMWSIRVKTRHLPQSWRRIPATIVSHVLIEDDE